MAKIEQAAEKYSFDKWGDIRENGYEKQAANCKKDFIAGANWAQENRWIYFDTKPPLYKTICMCYKDGRIDGGVFNSKQEIEMWEHDYKPVAWMELILPPVLSRI